MMQEFGYHTIRDAQEGEFYEQLIRDEIERNKQEDEIIAQTQTLIPELLADGQAMNIMDLMVVISEKLDLDTGDIHHGIRSAVWRLISDHSLLLSSDYKITLNSDL